MREIKFRAWHKNELFKFVELTSYKDGSLGINIAKTGFSDLISAPDGTIVEQFTGLTDKNGKDIYEGDIIRNFQADVNIVHWYVDSWCYENFHAGALPLGDTCNPYKNKMNGIAENQSEHEVIGNIHENPELLNK